MAKKQAAKEISAIEALSTLRERNRRMTSEQYIEKIGLGKKFQQFAGKKNLKIL